MTVFNDFAIISDFELEPKEDNTDDKYEITEIIELIQNGRVLLQKNGEDLCLIDTTQSNAIIGKLNNLRFR